MECDTCGKVYKNKFTLKSHKSSVHSNNKTFLCGVKLCGQGFSKRCLLLSHISYKHNDSRTYKCPTCIKMFKTRVNLNAHMKVHGEGEKCRICQGTFKSLTRHIKTKHTKRVRISCTYQDCCHTAADEASLKSHVKYIHTRAEQPTHACYFCSKAFISKWGRNKHLASHTKEFPYKCDTCVKLYTSGGALKEHVGRVHSGTRFACPHCGITYASKSSVIEHIRRNHTDYETKRPECNFCSKCFRSNGNLEDHIRAMHTKEEPYACTLCSYTATSSCKLIQHKTTRHTKRKLMCCYFCGVNLLSREGYLQHVRLHTLEKPYRCPHCPEFWTSTTSGLNFHQNMVHTNVWFDCPIDKCGKKYKIKRQLNRHLTTTHKLLKADLIY